MGSARLPFVALALGVLAVAFPAPAVAQDPEPPAHLAYADGTVTLERESEAEEAGAGLVLLPGDRLRTSAGRAEILFPDGSALAIDEYTVVELLDSSLVRLTAGRALLTVSGTADPAGAVRYQIDTPASSVTTEGPGEYRVAVTSFPSGAETELSVLRGFAVIATERDSIRVRSGEQSAAREGFAPSFARAFNSARYEAFDRWVNARREERMGYRTASRSAQYLPADLRMYGGTLDRYGAWGQEPSYGYVWYPTVAPAWRPYYHGSWSSLRGYGWTWTGLDVWSWPTHHYGRWGHSGSRWFWRPDRRWGPAWVSWGSAPGYVGWCPLGFDNRPVFAMSASSRNPWNGWVALPRERFGARGAFVHREAVPPRSFNNTPFITHAQAPVAPRAVPRNGNVRNGNVVDATRNRPATGIPADSRGRRLRPGGSTDQNPLEPRGRRAAAVPRNPEQAAVGAPSPQGRETGSSGVVRQGPPGRTSPAVPASPGRPPQRAMPRTASPTDPTGTAPEYTRRAGPGVVNGPRPGVVTRMPTPEVPPLPSAPAYNPSGGVVRGGAGRVSAAPGASGGPDSNGPGGNADRPGAVRRSPPPPAAAPPASYPRESQPRQPVSAAPPQEAAPATSAGSAPARRGSGASGGDSGRARRR